MSRTSGSRFQPSPSGGSVLTYCSSPPDRDLVTPPQLAGDAPGADVLHPVHVDARVVLGPEANLAGPHHVDGGLGQLLHPHEPLERDQRLDPLARALRERHLVRVGLGAGDQALLAQLGHDRLAGLLDGHPAEALRRLVGDARILTDHADLRQSVAAADLEVVGVVPGGDLQRAGAEFGLDVVVGDDLQLAADQRQDRLLPHQPTVPLVVRVHGDRHVGQHRLGPHGGHRDRARAGGQRVVDVVQGVGDLAVLDLEVGDRGALARVPIDHVPVAIDVALLVKLDEHLLDRARVALVEREALVVVIQRGAEPLELLDDLAAVVIAPAPDAGDERVSPELLLAGALGHHGPLDLDLGGDSRVVGAEDPLRPLAAHPVVADQAVLDRVVQRVPHVEHPCDVRQRDRDRVVL